MVSQHLASRNNQNQSKPFVLEHFAPKTLQNCRQTNKQLSQTNKNKSKLKEIQHLAPKTIEHLRKKQKYQTPIKAHRN